MIKGHWRKGKKRHNEASDIVELLRIVVQKATINRTARYLNISPRTLKRWLSGEDNPNPKLIANAITASMTPAHPTGVSEWSRRMSHWKDFTVPYGGETGKLYYGDHYEN